jgi:hypothetical protein
MRILFLVLLIIVNSCSQKQEFKEEVVVKPILKIHERLMFFDNEFLLDVNPENFEKLDSEIKVTYVDDLIIVTKLELTNACPKYAGNIEINKKSIILISKIITDDICDSNEIRKFTYIIKNPQKRKYKFSMRED